MLPYIHAIKYLKSHTQKTVPIQGAWLNVTNRTIFALFVASSNVFRLYFSLCFFSWYCTFFFFLHLIMYISPIIQLCQLFATNLKWAMTWDFQQCGMCDQQRLRPACAYAQSDQSLCSPLEYFMSVKLLPEHHLEFVSLKGGCTGSSESTLVKMPHCWKSHVLAQILLSMYTSWIVCDHLSVNFH